MFASNGAIVDGDSVDALTSVVSKSVLCIVILFSILNMVSSLASVFVTVSCGFHNSVMKDVISLVAEVSVLPTSLVIGE